MTKYLIKGGSIVNAWGTKGADILVENGKIVRVGKGIDAQDATPLNAIGCLVFPGLIDTHTHLDLVAGGVRTADRFPSGTAAAVVGGTTTVLDFATQERGMTMCDAFDEWTGKAKGASCNYGFHMAVSEWNDDRAAEMDEMVRRGVTSFKMYMVYDNMIVSDGELYAALQETKKRGCLIGVHCENYSVLTRRVEELRAQGRLGYEAHPVSRPADVEAEAVARLMRIARLAGAPVYVVHLSTKEGLEEALRARARGQEVYLETCPQYLVLDESRYAEPDAAKYVMSPPLRTKEDNEALWRAIGTGKIQFIGTDHCSFTMEQKTAAGTDFSHTPNGCAGVQNRLDVIYTRGVRPGRLMISQMVRALSYNASRLFGMPDKGEIREGADADIVVFNPVRERRISAASNLHACDNSPYEGMYVWGLNRYVLVNGEVAVEDGQLVKTGLGRYVRREACGRLDG